MREAFESTSKLLRSLLDAAGDRASLAWRKYLIGIPPNIEDLIRQHVERHRLQEKWIQGEYDGKEDKDGDKGEDNNNDEEDDGNEEEDEDEDEENEERSEERSLKYARR